ncbi:3,4-dihydroxy-2-butanone 4-phosphate synthase / GTP cyclohydrolase II [Spiroplasma syrphidicola EA-1]|uniref:GTP cyclohydrolase-2 n=1 Tax=Spiroplasma syrphidicola EA-1 TaxID=1276229 RepID=R4UM65_9MOLU|nr:GTP cyclohydrolase II [Spiroplasma syrphidicola]AGM26326.1 3,4-dihydroxy-2-butanone 4-phosphate synthase / GTP cyclohydrolase II [Spiroplasma syrphidicola EA-1]
MGENSLTNVVSAKLPTKYGNFALRLFSDQNGREIIKAIIKEPLNLNQPVLVRLHSECFTGDVLGSLRCDCGEQLANALEAINASTGVVLYLPQEGRGIGLVNKLKAYNLQDEGYDTVQANEQLGFAPDLRHYDSASVALALLGIKEVNLLTNNPDKIEQLIANGINVTARTPLIVGKNETNEKYFQAKKDKMGHLL